MLTFLPLLFLAVAMLYAMAGFGGGSTYIALLAISELPLAVIPIISLSCNLLVSSQGSILLIRKGNADWAILSPLLLTSIPLSFLGGAWRLNEGTFLPILALCLSLAGAAMIFQHFLDQNEEATTNAPPIFVLMLTGGLLGLVAGITGIGGGIYLAPVMHLLRWAPPKTIATCTSLFIVLNSLSGLTGQLTKGYPLISSIPLWILIGCPVGVILGGRLGSHFLSKKLANHTIRTITAAVILIVAARLWIKVAGS